MFPKFYKKVRVLPIKVIFQVLLGIQHFKQGLINQCTQEQSSKFYITPKLKFYKNFYILNRRSAYVDILRNKTGNGMSLLKYAISWVHSYNKKSFSSNVLYGVSECLLFCLHLR
jgi:hypothetical protein